MPVSGDTEEEGRNARVSGIRILLAEKHSVVRAGLRHELGKVPGAWVIAEAQNGQEALRLAEEFKPDIVVMGIALPRLNGLESTRWLTKALPGTKVLIFSRHDEEEYVWRAIRKGASGYLLKRASLEELPEAVLRVHRGELYISREIADRLIAKMAARPVAFTTSPLEQLTLRQCEILQLIAEGRNTKEIAAVLEVSPKTVDFHRAQLMDRLQIWDVPGLIRLALREKLVESD
ncbi:MAG TPA: response regulator transcription factor [Candidatus Dormibacteraeota bacterium]|nr:response regulator transcription factor [Candidatus Dormibacteraeota bacterium]